MQARLNILSFDNFTRLVVFTIFVILALSFSITADAQEAVSEEEYRNRVSKISDDHHKALDDLSTILQAKPNPILWTSDDTIKTAADTVVIENSYSELQKTAPPEKYKEVHTILLQGLQKHSEAMPLLRQGVDTLNANLITASSTKIQEGTALIKQATDKLTALNAAAPPQGKKDSECFIATAAYGTPYANDLDTLRNARDNDLRHNAFGRQFIHGYYKAGPIAADVIRNKPVLRFIVREAYIKPLVKITQFFQAIA